MNRSNFSRRRFVRAGAAWSAAVAAPLWAPTAVQAQGAYPNRPIKVVIGTPPGNASDVTTRQIVEPMARLLGQPLVVDNKTGAHGMIAAAAVKSAPADGYTLLSSSSGPMSINPAVYKEKLTYDPLKDFVPVAPTMRGTLFLVCNNDLPVRNLKDMVAWVKERPGKVSFGSGGTGTTQHLSMEMLKKATGMEMTHVPYRGSPQALSDLMGGLIPFVFDTGANVLTQYRAGKVRILAVSSPQRDPILPDVPTVAEQGVPGYESRVWMGLFALAGTPADLVARLNEAASKAAATPEFEKFIATTGGNVWTASPADFRRAVAADIERWAVVVQAAGVKADG